MAPVILRALKGWHPRPRVQGCCPYELEQDGSATGSDYARQTKTSHGA